MRRLVRGLAMIGLVAGVGYAVFTLTRLAKDASADQFDDYAPKPAKPKPADQEQPDSADPDPQHSDTPMKPASEQWPLRPPQES